MSSLMKKVLLAAACLGMLVAIPHTAGAVPNLATAAISFDPDGSGNAPAVPGVTTFNFNAGNALAIGAVPALADFQNSGGAVQTPFDVILQTTLKNFATPAAALSAGAEITMVLRATQVIVPGPAVSVAVVPGASSFLNLYYDSTADANAATGSGFNDGVLILAAAMLGGTGNIANLGGIPAPFLDSVASTGPPSLNLDGTAAFNVMVSFSDSAFFVTTPAAATFTTAPVAPFNAAVSAALAFPAFGVVPNLGTINGMTGPDVQYMANSELAFQRIPEPSTLSLLSLALLSLLVRRFPRRPG